MGRIVSMSAATKIKMTTIQKEIWFFTKIISTVSISMFCICEWHHSPSSRYLMAKNVLLCFFKNMFPHWWPNI